MLRRLRKKLQLIEIWGGVRENQANPGSGFWRIPEKKLTRFWIQTVTGFTGMILCAPWMDLDDFRCIFKFEFKIFTFW